MTMSGSGDITTLLASWKSGQATAMNALFPLVYEELRRISRRQRRRVWSGTMDTTALVHEAYLKLVDQKQAGWQDRAHFFAVSAIAMRQILINYAESKRTQKRGGNWRRVTFDDARGSPVTHGAETLLAVDEAMERLRKVDERLASIVEYRFFGGLTEAEIGCVLGLSERTVRREWRKARAFLSSTLSDGQQKTFFG